MLALITGASNGLGKDFAKELSKQGYDLVLVARSKDKLDKLSSELKTLVYVEVMDLSVKENAYKLYSKYKGKIDLLIVIGENVDNYEKGFGNENIRKFASKDDFFKEVDSLIKKDDVILVKASRGMKFEEVTSKLKELK